MSGIRALNLVLASATCTEVVGFGYGWKMIKGNGLEEQLEQQSCEDLLAAKFVDLAPATENDVDSVLYLRFDVPGNRWGDEVQKELWSDANAIAANVRHSDPKYVILQFPEKHCLSDKRLKSTVHAKKHAGRFGSHWEYQISWFVAQNSNAEWTFNRTHWFRVSDLKQKSSAVGLSSEAMGALYGYLDPFRGWFGTRTPLNYTIAKMYTMAVYTIFNLI